MKWIRLNDSPFVFFGSDFVIQTSQSFLVAETVIDSDDWNPVRLPILSEKIRVKQNIPSFTIGICQKLIRSSSCQAVFYPYFLFDQFSRIRVDQLRLMVQKQTIKICVELHKRNLENLLVAVDEVPI